MTDNLKNTYIGKIIEVVTSTGQLRNGVILDIIYHEGLKEDVYLCKSFRGNNFRLTRREFTVVRDVIFHGFTN